MGSEGSSLMWGPGAQLYEDRDGSDLPMPSSMRKASVSPHREAEGSLTVLGLCHRNTTVGFGKGLVKCARLG